MPNSDLVKEAIDAVEKMGGGKLTAAKYLCNKYPLQYYNIQQARNAVRYYTGSRGDELRKNLKDKEYMYKLSDLPTSHAEVWQPYIFPEQYSKVLVLSDIHIPYQDNVALDAAITYGIKNKMNCVLINGDMLDMYQISRFEKRPDKPSLALEFEAGKSFIDMMRNTFGNVVFKVGNHSERWERFLMQNPALLGFKDFELKTILGLKPEEYVSSKRVMKAGKLTVIHGHELSRGANSPVNFAKTLFNKLGESTLAGHLHQTSEHSFTRQPSGDIVTCWSVGTLGDLHPDYSPLPQWNNGFATIETETNGNYHVENLRIKDGKIY